MDVVFYTPDGEARSGRRIAAKRRSSGGVLAALAEAVATMEGLSPEDRARVCGITIKEGKMGGGGFRFERPAPRTPAKKPAKKR